MYFTLKISRISIDYILNMLEKEAQGYIPKVEVVYTSEQSGPFSVGKKGAQWQLGVNKSYFESRGFLPDEITGAIYLEEERLTKQTGVTTQANVEGLKKWQELANQDPKAVAFKAVFERLAALSSLKEKDAERMQLARKYLGKFASISPGPTNTEQLFNAILKMGLGEEATPESKVVATVLNNLQKKEKVEGRNISPFDALLSPNISSAARASWFEARFLPRLQFLERQDETPEKPQEMTETDGPSKPQDTTHAKQEQMPPTPSSAQDEYEQHRGREEKGKSQPIFAINPGFTGYWEEDSFDSIDERSGRLIKSGIQRIKTAITTTADQILGDSTRTISGYSGINLFSLPLAPSFQLTQGGLNSLGSQDIEVFTDTEGHVFLKSSANIPIHAEIAIGTTIVNTGIKSKDNTITQQVLPEEVDIELNRIKSLPTDSLGKIQQLVDFMKRYFKYPNDSQVESMYARVDNSAARISTMASAKVLDCYLAREFFLAGLKRLDLPDIEWRGVNGHFISSRQKDGSTEIHSGTGHAWVKLRPDEQKTWMIIDPTPPGDPVHQGENSMEQLEEFSDQPISSEDLEELQNEAEDLESTSEKKPTPSADQYLVEFAREAGVLPEEAQQILNTLAEVDQLKDRQGRLITARLREQFARIIEEYSHIIQEPLGTVEMSRGRDLEEPVSAFIDFRSGNLDPTGFSKKRPVEQKEQYYSGWDLEIVTDGSGSMKDPLGGKPKYLVQRTMSYLLHRELHRFSQDAQRRRLRLVTPLKIRSSQYMFRQEQNNRGNGVGKIEEIKSLTDGFTPPQMALLWKKSAENIGGGTPAHLGLEAILDRIPPEEVQLLKDKKLLKVVALISDGGYDDATRVNNLITRLQDMNVVVAEFPITDARSLEDLPQNVAEKVIETARLLMPQKIRRN